MTDFDIIREALARIEARSAPAAPPPPLAPVAPTLDASEFFSDYGKFYDWLRGNSMLGPQISKEEFEGCDVIVRACGDAQFPIAYTAYTLATAYHETAHSMQPVMEIGGKAYYTRMYDIKGSRPAKARELGNLTPGDGAKFAGRGYPQLTGKTNYETATTKLREMGYDVDLVADPDALLRPEIAAPVMVYGMRDGWFTGRKLSNDLPRAGIATLDQFIASRDIINGTDKAALIGGYAIHWQSALVAGGYRIRT